MEVLWNANHYLVTGFFKHKGIISAIKRVEFISVIYNTYEVVILLF
jgi:hypothetical protein